MHLFADQTITYEPGRSISNNIACAPAKTQISLRIRARWSVFAVRL